MPTVTESANKAAFRRMLDAANSHDDERMSQTFDEVFRSDVVLHTPVPTRAAGVEAMKEIFVTLHRAFPDLRVTIDDVIEEGDKVVARQTVTGTHLGRFMGMPPTRKSVTYDEIFIFRFVRGRVAEIWGVVDVVSYLKQLGVIDA